MHGDVDAVDRSAPQRLARRPIRTNLNLATVHEKDRDAVAPGLDLKFDAGLAHRDHAFELETHLLGLAQLP